MTAEIPPGPYYPEWRQMAERAIASKLDLPYLYSGGHVIRNEKGWRVNEKEIEMSGLFLSSIHSMAHSL
jgi:hypothetical protein